MAFPWEPYGIPMGNRGIITDEHVLTVGNHVIPMGDHAIPMSARGIAIWMTIGCHGRQRHSHGLP